MRQYIRVVNQTCISKCKGWVQWIHQQLSRLKLVHAERGKKVKTLSTEKLTPSTARLNKMLDDKKKQTHYFVEARSWADDLYTSAIISRNRYKYAFFIAMGFSVLLAIAMDGLIPLQHMEPLLINHYQDGRTSVLPMKQPYAPLNQAEVESDIVRYLINRESYDPSSYDTQYSLIHLLSDNEVSREYREVQSTSDPHSPINTLGDRGFRTVHVDNVIFLDSVLNNKNKPSSQQTHNNLAQIDFTITDHVNNSAIRKTKALTALMAWRYEGTPEDPEDRWRNWNGFTVTRYTVEQRNI